MPLGTLRSHADRVITFFAADFAPIVGAMPLVGQVARAAYDALKPSAWQGVPSGYLLRDPPGRKVFFFSNGRFQAQTLGLDRWIDGLSVWSKTLVAGLHQLEVQKLKRVGFAIWAFLPLKMSHAEISSLMFGSFLQSEASLERVCGKPEDVLVQLHGARNNLKIMTVVAPQTSEQASQRMLATTNIEQFLESKFLDTTIKEFHDRVRDECLLLDVDLYREDVDLDQVTAFGKEAVEEVERIADAVVDQLRSLPAKKGGR